MRLSPDRLLLLVNIGGLLLATALPIAIFLWRVPSNKLARSALAVVLAWLVIGVYSALVVNPVGISAARAAGEHFPEGRFDNNTIASAIVAGWLAPLISVAVAALVKWVAVKKSASAERRTLNTSLERTRDR